MSAGQAISPSGSFVERLIDVTLSLGTGPDGTGTPTVTTYSGLRVSVNVDMPGSPAAPAAQITMYGLTQSDLNKLSSIGLSDTRISHNFVTVTAGDAVSGMSTVFYGSFNVSYADFQSGPDAALQIVALAGGIDMIKPVPPSSYNGSVDAATVMEGLAKVMGYQFENDGVSVQLSNPYFAGTAFDQIEACAKAANITFDMSNNILSIWPVRGHRNKPTPIVSPSTGMIGYPAYASNGLTLSTLFNPAIIPGGKIQVQSSIPAACGNWVVYSMSHTLESKTPDGQWRTDVMAFTAQAAANAGVIQQ